MATSTNHERRSSTSYEEKGVWTSLVVSVGVSIWYAAVVLGRLQQTSAERLDFGPALLLAIGVSIGASIIVRILVEILSPSDSYKVDARDKEIGRRGSYVMGMVVAIGMIGPLLLAIISADAFWIANAMFAIYIIGSVAGNIVQLVAYRRGF